MSYGEREAATGLITSLIVLALFLWRLSGQYEAGLFEGPEALQIWARSVLVLVAWSIGIAIVVTIGFHIVYEVVTGEKTDDRRDERDRDIQRRALTWAWYLLSFGLLGVIINLALGATAFLAMNMVLGLCVLSEIFNDGFKIWLYRRAA
jgi:heme/copper-type cytochrome/quinol oxidase subunit 2